MIRKVVLDLDAFAKPVQVNFRGRERFATMRGGFLTILVYLATTWFSFSLLIRFIHRVDPEIQNYETRLDE